MKLTFDPTLNLTTLLTIALLVGQGAVVLQRVKVLEEGQREIRVSLQVYTERNNEAHSMLLQSLAKTAAILDSHIERKP